MKKSEIIVDTNVPDLDHHIIVSLCGGRAPGTDNTAGRHAGWGSNLILG